MSAAEVSSPMRCKNSKTAGFSLPSHAPLGVAATMEPVKPTYCVLTTAAPPPECWPTGSPRPACALSVRRQGSKRADTSPLSRLAEGSNVVSIAICASSGNPTRRSETVLSMPWHFAHWTRQYGNKRPQALPSFVLPSKVATTAFCTFGGSASRKATCFSSSFQRVPNCRTLDSTPWAEILTTPGGASYDACSNRKWLMTSARAPVLRATR
mmetsp:Transcript_35969/g.99105  ORF Transcript_35969/g.99105 Transcript_35969/m.99105 type:complete len:211 (+) Transcript_35969:237-869(+)